MGLEGKLAIQGDSGDTPTSTPMSTLRLQDMQGYDFTMALASTEPYAATKPDVTSRVQSERTATTKPAPFSHALSDRGAVARGALLRNEQEESAGVFRSKSGDVERRAAREKKV